MNSTNIPNYADLHNSSSPKLPSRISCTTSKQLGPLISGSESLSQELQIAVGAVQMACFLCQRVQSNLLKNNNAHIQAKDDHSPVTVAGNSFGFSSFRTTVRLLRESDTLV